MTLPKRGTKEWAELKNRLYDYGPEMYELLSGLIEPDIHPAESVWPWQQDIRALFARIDGESDE